MDKTKLNKTKLNKMKSNKMKSKIRKQQEDIKHQQDIEEEEERVNELLAKEGKISTDSWEYIYE